MPPGKGGYRADPDLISGCGDFASLPGGLAPGKMLDFETAAESCGPPF